MNCAFACHDGTSSVSFPGKCDVNFIYLVLHSFKKFPFGDEMLANDLKPVTTQGEKIYGPSYNIKRYYVIYNITVI